MSILYIRSRYRFTYFHLLRNSSTELLYISSYQTYEREIKSWLTFISPNQFNYQQCYNFRNHSRIFLVCFHFLKATAGELCHRRSEKVRHLNVNKNSYYFQVNDTRLKGSAANGPFDVCVFRNNNYTMKNTSFCRLKVIFSHNCCIY